MVLSFRHTELQSVVGVSSDSREARRTDLMQRALSMIDRGVSPAVESKIRDLYRKSGASTSRNSLMYSRRLASQTSSSLGTSTSSRSGTSSLCCYLFHNGVRFLRPFVLICLDCFCGLFSYDYEYELQLASLIIFCHL